MIAFFDRRFFRNLPPWVLDSFLIAVVAALAYLPLAAQLGLYFDDWYLIYAGKTQGIQKFWDIFIIDRPLRALQVGAWFAMFGDHPLPYSLTAYLWRVLGAFGLMRIGRILWPRKRAATLVMAVFFVIYPGFLNQTNAIDYQSHLLSLCLALWSIVFSLEALCTPRRARAWLFGVLSFISCVVYLGLMEYYIGLEALRFTAIAVMEFRQAGGVLTRLRHTLVRWLPFAAAPAAFLFWRVFLFQNQRGATDLGSVVSGFTGSPLLRGLWTLVVLLQDTFNTVVFAWAIPAYQIVFRLRLRDFLLAFIIGLAAAVIVAVVIRRIDHELDSSDDRRFRTEAVALGLVVVIGALLPVALGERNITFPTFSRFTLTPSVGGCMALTGILCSVRRGWWRVGLIATLVFLAVMTHYGNAQNAVYETRAIQSFWWQVTWRIPGIRQNTNLVANYATASTPEDYFVWSPANLIYYPEKKAANPTPISLPAIIINSDSVLKILSGAAPETIERRGLVLTRDYENVLVLSRPTPGSCVQVMDGNQPEYSSSEEYNVMLVAPFSRISNVIPSSDLLQMPPNIFGPEPEHDWCYYYEKATLARQLGDWEQIAALGDQAIASDLRPLDRVEWLPFVQAYAHTGNDAQVRALAPVVNEQPFLSMQVCNGVVDGLPWYANLDPEMKAEMETLFCR